MNDINVTTEKKITSPTRIVVFEQNGSGHQKIDGIRKHGHNVKINKIYNIEASLPEFVEDPEKFIPENFTADLVLDFLKHPDLSEYLAKLCVNKKIPVVASGKKVKEAITPFTCCGLGKHKSLQSYSKEFGLPEFIIDVDDDGIIRDLKVVRGAPCGATWEVLSKMIGMSFEKALSTLPREVQYICGADPSRFDPISGKSPLHYAGDVHSAALKKAIHNAKKKKSG